MRVLCSVILLLNIISDCCADEIGHSPSGFFRLSASIEETSLGVSLSSKASDNKLSLRVNIPDLSDKIFNDRKQFPESVRVTDDGMILFVFQSKIVCVVRTDKGEIPQFTLSRNRQHQTAPSVASGAFHSDDYSYAFLFMHVREKCVGVASSNGDLTCWSLESKQSITVDADLRDVAILAMKESVRRDLAFLSNCIWNDATAPFLSSLAICCSSIAANFELERCKDNLRSLLDCSATFNRCIRADHSRRYFGDGVANNRFASYVVRFAAQQALRRMGEEPVVRAVVVLLSDNGDSGIEFGIPRINNADTLKAASDSISLQRLIDLFGAPAFYDSASFYFLDASGIFYSFSLGQDGLFHADRICSKSSLVNLMTSESAFQIADP